jgi:hypothetical protein
MTAAPASWKRSGTTRASICGLPLPRRVRCASIGRTASLGGFGCSAKRLAWLARAANPFGVSVSSNGGFDPLTAKQRLAEEIIACGVQAEILHVGDFDPSGEHVFSALAEDVTAFVAARSSRPPTFTRLAVTPQQIAELGLPGAPPKAGDRRSFSGVTAVQAEAIAPDVLVGIVTGAIKSRQRAAIRTAALNREAAMRREIIARLEAGQ